MRLLKCGSFSWTIIILYSVLFLNEVVSEDQWQQCRDKCDASLNRGELWHGKYLCVAADDDADPEPMSTCLAECLEYKIFKDQAQCWCNYCKIDDEHKHFCTEPGDDNFIGSDQCDQLVCTGLADYYGRFCQASPDIQYDAQKSYGENIKLLNKKCQSSCSVSNLEDMFKGQSLCNFVEVNNVAVPKFMGKCYWDCMNITIDEGLSQDDCACSFCKQAPSNHENFCMKPGWRTYIGKNQCDALVCKGEAKYHGIYCNPDTKEQFKEAQTKFDEDPTEKRETCWDKCGGKPKLLRETWKGELWCAENEDCDDGEPTWATKCFFDCMEIAIAENQTSCACKHCHFSPVAHESYCEKPGVNAHIRQDECEEKVCSGIMTNHGQFCRFQTKEEFGYQEKLYGDKYEIYKRCFGTCGGLKELQRAMFNGNASCGYPDWTSYEHNETVRISSHEPEMLTSCMFECMGVKIEDDPQNFSKCAIDYCDSYTRHRYFCSERGLDKSIGEDECEAKILNGDAKFYGYYCNATQEKIEEAEKEFGDGKKEQIKQCTETCGGEKHSDMDLYRGNLVCGYVDYGDYKGPDITSRCFLTCMGFQVDKDQRQCSCEMCKREDYHKGFCLKPGVQTSISKNDCDKLACTKQAKFHGRFCELNSSAEAEQAENEFGVPTTTTEKPATIAPGTPPTSAPPPPPPTSAPPPPPPPPPPTPPPPASKPQTCAEKCLDSDDEKRARYRGEYKCALHKGKKKKAEFGSKCYFDCIGLKEARDQRECACYYCYNDLFNHLDFCEKPGFGVVKHKNCNSPCGGHVKWYGYDFCYPDSKDIADGDKAKYGN